MPHTPVSHPCVERQGDTPGVGSGKALPLHSRLRRTSWPSPIAGVLVNLQEHPGRA